MPQQPIDIVLTWVDGEDSQWLEQRAAASGKTSAATSILNHASRYREIGLLRYVLRSINTYAPWVRNIFLVTPGQRPSWLPEISSSKLVLIDQNDIIPNEFQPCYKSTGVEWHLHRIPGLSEHFIYMNDDMLFNAPVSPEDFFVDGIPRLTAIYRPLPINNFSHMVLSTLVALNRNHVQGKISRSMPGKFFNPFIHPLYARNTIYRSLDQFSSKDSLKTSYLFPHVALPLRKKTIHKIWEKEYKALKETCSRPFRDNADILIWLAMFWEIENGTFVPQNPAETKLIYADNIESIKNTLNNTKIKQYCINDSEDIDKLTEEILTNINSLMKSKYSTPSPYEI